jgi:hypothetical protein
MNIIKTKDMETTIFEISFEDGSKFRVFCSGRNQIKRFGEITLKLTGIKEIIELTNGIHTISEFEKIMNPAVSQSTLDEIIKYSKL